MRFSSHMMMKVLKITLSSKHFTEQDGSRLLKVSVDKYELRNSVR
jgi:hypothetical protein